MSDEAGQTAQASGTAQGASQGVAQGAAQGVRTDRDRFVAFAFAAADILLQLDTDLRVTYASGALSKLEVGDATGMGSLRDVVMSQDLGFLSELLHRVSMGGKTEPVMARLRGHTGAATPALIGCCRLPSAPHSIFLTATFVSPAATAGGEGIADRATFERVVRSKLNHAATMGQTVGMTYLTVEGLDGYRQIADTDELDELLDSMTSYMRAVSIGGDGVGRLGDDRFAVIHGRDVKGAAIRARVSDIAHEAAGDSMTVVSETVDVTPDPLSEADVVRALLYSLRQYEAGADDLSVAAVMKSARNTMSKAMPRMAEVRAVIKARAINLVFQPIVSIETGRAHHFEALSRVDGFPSIQEFIGFAEETGMIEEFDLAVLDRALVEMGAQAELGFTPDVAVNLSARSVQSDTFLSNLNGLLRKHVSLVPKLLFELTETVTIRDFAAANRRVQELRRHGNKVCLDDVGAGGTSFKSLQAIDVDYAKLDGSLIQGSRKNVQTKRLLQSVLEYCQDSKTEVIAEFIETKDDETLVRDGGVGYGQGLLYGAARADWREAYEDLTR